MVGVAARGMFEIAQSLGVCPVEDIDQMAKSTGKAGSKEIAWRFVEILPAFRSYLR